MAASQNAVVLPDADARGLGRLLRQRGFQVQQRPRPSCSCLQAGLRRGLVRVCAAWRRAPLQRRSGRGRERARAAAAACGGAGSSAEAGCGRAAQMNLGVCRADVADSPGSEQDNAMLGPSPTAHAHVRWHAGPCASEGGCASCGQGPPRQRPASCRAERRVLRSPVAERAAQRGRPQASARGSASSACHARPVRGALPSKARAQVFVRGGALYAFRGLGGKLGPIGVHAAMLAIMAGAPRRRPRRPRRLGQAAPLLHSPVRPAGGACAVRSAARRRAPRSAGLPGGPARGALRARRPAAAPQAGAWLEQGVGYLP
jgi:hypothetical protein